MKKKIKLSDENKREMKHKISTYFSEERDEDLGELASQLVLDFFIEELAPHIYNQGVEDAHNYMNDKIEDLFALQIVRR
ncbi:MAG: DUF2164 domain-containing protein [Tissierella sp.]|uniref:DUF2164 domain-containing protein n=1 Tax=Tissierella sp. TaxID=41274 RepID=UPI003F9A00D8